MDPIAAPRSPSPAPSSHSSSEKSSTIGDLDAHHGTHYVDLEARGSRPPGLGRNGSFASARTAQDTLAGLTEEERELRRQETIEELRSVYSRRTENDGELDAPNDASSFIDLDPELVTWDGPDDPENPRNFPSSVKWRITMMMSLYTFVSPFASSIAAPAALAYSEEFGITSPTISGMTISIFLIGYACGPLIFAPLSEMWGRVYVMHASVIAFLIFNIACAVAQTTGEMLAFRLLSGMAGSAPFALGAGVLSDVWAPMELARAMAFFSLGPLVSPICAPIAAAFITQSISWRWVFWVLSIVTGVTMVVGFLLFNTETYAVAILNKRAARLRKETGNPNLHTVFEVNKDIKTSFKIALTRPFLLLVLNPVLLSLGLFMAFVYGFLYLMFVTFPDLFQGVYHMRSGIAGLNYLAPGVGFLVGLPLFTILLQRFYVKLTAANNGVSVPEYRLPSLFLAGIIIPIGLIWYGWSAEKRLHWIMPDIGVAIFSCGLISIFSVVQTYLIDMSPRFAASAVSAATVFRSLFGFAFPLFGQQMYAKLGYGWANTMLAFIALVLGLVFPLLVFRYGASWREAADRRVSAIEAKLMTRVGGTNGAGKVASVVNIPTDPARQRTSYDSEESNRSTPEEKTTPELAS